MMSEGRFLETDWRAPQYVKASVSGTGSAQALPMSEEEKKEADARRIPLGFVGQEPKSKPRRRAAKPKKGAGF